MGWEDSIAGFTQPPAGGGSWAPPKASAPSGGFGGFSGFGSSNSSNWLGNFTAAKPKAAGYTPPAFPESIGIQFPWSSNPKQPALVRRDTTGDWVGSLGASLDNSLWNNGYLNIANAIPWAEERTFVAAKELADRAAGKGNPISQAIEGFGGAIKAISEPLAQVLDFFPNLVRDSSLNSRTAIYKALVTGKTVDPLQTFGSMNPGMPGLNIYQYQIKAVNDIAGLIAGGRASSSEITKARAMVAEMIDLPASVKKGITENPNGDFAKYLDQAPEGRQVSYAEGLQGAASNFIGMGSLYVLEIMLTGGAAAYLRAVSGGAAVGANVLGYAAGATRAQNAYGIAAAGASIMAKAQRVALASGITYFGASTLTDTVLRTMGNKEGVAYLDKINRTALISDSHAVQLVSSFTVNPIAAAKLAVKGELRFLGSPMIVVDKVTGGRFLHLYNHEDIVLDRLAKMYGTSKVGAAELIGPGRVYETKTDAFDQIVQLAADAFIQKLPETAKSALNALPRAQRTQVLFSRYGKQILDEVDKPVGMIARFRGDWAYHDFYGRFDKDIAGMVARDYRMAARKTAAAQEAIDAVPGYVDFLNPQGQRDVTDAIEAIFADGRQGTLKDLNALSAKHPSLNGLVADLVAKGDNGRPFLDPGDIVPRGVFDTALERAKLAYEAEWSKNPIRVATGVDPILRPNAHAREWAAALDTSEETIEALRVTTRTPAQDALVAGFVRQKGLATDVEIAAASADDLLVKATNYLDTTTAPWVKRGADVAVIEAQIGAAGARLAELRSRRAAGESVAIGEKAAYEAELAKLQSLLSDVRDPAVPFASGVRSATRADTEAVVRARRKIDAQERVDAITSVVDEIAPAQVHAVNDLLHSVERAADGTWAWVADSRVFSGPLFDAAVARFNAWRFPPGRTTRARGNRPSRSAGQTEESRRFNQSPPEYQAAEMADSPGFLRSLNAKPDEMAPVPAIYGEGGVTEVPFREIAALVEANARTAPVVTEITQPMIEALGVATRDAFIERLGTLRGTYDDALAGRNLYNLSRTAGIKVPDWALEQARKGERAALFRNPVAETDYENALVSLRDALDGAFPAVKGIVEGDPLLRAQARELAVQHGQTLDAFLSNAANSEKIRLLVQEADRYVPGVPKAQTALDAAVLASDPKALADLKVNLAEIRVRPTPPLRNVPIEAVDALASQPRLSTTLARDLDATGIHWNALIPEVLWEKSAAGANALSVILTGTLEQRPKTVMGLLSALKEIENGNAANMGIGTQLAAEAQSLGQRVIANMIGDVRKAQLEVGVIGMGHMMNPRTWSEETNRLIQDLFGQEGIGGRMIFRDETGLQYGLKSRPRGKVDPETGQLRGQAVAVDMDSVPGLSEELLVGRFQPWHERVGSVRLRQAWGRAFNLNNQQIMFEARARFEQQMAKYGVSPKAAEAVWTAWRQFAKDSRGEAWRLRNKKLTKEPASSALYATEKNIPNAKLETIGRAALEDYYKTRGGMPESLNSVRLADEMRTASSWTRRQVGKAPVLGDFLADTYGMFAHNEWVTTKYFMFRFALDARFHAQNKIEASALYYGRAGLKAPEISQGMFGQTKAAVRTMDELDTMSNTGYPFAVTREEWIYRTLLKEQPDALRGLVEADPALFRRALREIAEQDPELSATIAHMRHTPDEYLRVMDAYYEKLMRSDNPEALIGAELAKDLVNNPELAEVYSRIYDRNAQLVGDIRSMMYGNPNRGQVERVLNSYLAYWPISYQIKATKWLLNVMYGKIGGVRTGGLGALKVDELMAEHQRRLVEDPEYAAFFEEHPTLVFAAQMLFPMTPFGIGAGLSPIVRDIFFPETAKNPLSIGPVYTITRFLPGVYGDLYPTLRDVPIVGEVADLGYKMTTGWQPPEEKKAALPYKPVTP
jgi:hypothetical protein